VGLEVGPVDEPVPASFALVHRLRAVNVAATSISHFTTLFQRGFRSSPYVNAPNDNKQKFTVVKRNAGHI